MSYYLQGLGTASDDINAYLNKTYGTPATNQIPITTATMDPDWKGPAPKPVTIFDPNMFAKQPTLFNAGVFGKKPSIDDQPAATLPPDDEGIPNWMIAAGVGALVLAIAAGVVVMKKKRKDS